MEIAAGVLACVASYRFCFPILPSLIPIIWTAAFRTLVEKWLIRYVSLSLCFCLSFRYLRNLIQPPRKTNAGLPSRDLRDYPARGVRFKVPSHISLTIKSHADSTTRFGAACMVRYASAGVGQEAPKMWLTVNYHPKSSGFSNLWIKCLTFSASFPGCANKSAVFRFPYHIILQYMIWSTSTRRIRKEAYT